MDKRPLVIITISFIIGIIIGLYLKINAVLFVFLFLIVIIIIYLLSAKYFLSRTKFDKVMYIGAFLMLLIAFFIMNVRERKYSSLYSNINSKVVVKGTVIEVQRESDYFDNYVIRVDSVDNNFKFKNTNILLKVKKNNKVNKLEYGDYILFCESYEKPSVRRNYKGFDYSEYLKTKNIYVIFKSDYNSIKLVKKNSLFVVNMWINGIRNKLKRNLIQLLNKKNADVANALLLGYSDSIDEENRIVFGDASLIHILAISGMHVTYVVLFWNGIFKNADNRRRKKSLILFLIFFVNLTGVAPSVMRASVMACFALVSKLFYRKSDTINNIAISCLIILIIDPYEIRNLGFQLSFLGTLGIVLFNKKIVDSVQKIESLIIQKNKWIANTADKFWGRLILKIFTKIKSIIILGISANILIIPIVIYTYNVFSLTFIISTILVTPILGLMIFTGYGTAITSLFSMKLACLISMLFNFFVNIFYGIAEFSSNISFLRITVVTPSLFEILIYYGLVFYFFLFYRRKHNKVLLKLSVILIIMGIVLNSLTMLNSGLKLYFIDVGQGDSCLIITENNKTILIDGGGSETGSYDIGKKVLVPYLLDRKVNKIDYMIFTHFDSDHCKGLFTVMSELTVKNAIISEQGKCSDNYNYFIQLANTKNINVIKVKARR